MSGPSFNTVFICLYSRIVLRHFMAPEKMRRHMPTVVTAELQ